MHLEHFALQFEKLFKQRSLNYSLGKPVTDDDILQTELRLGVSFPEQVAIFYRNFDGLHVEDPQLEVLPIKRLNFASLNRLHFAIVDHEHRLYFDTSQTNAAEQWDIVAEDGYCVTLSMASFWSNKIFAWVKKRRAIWKDNLEWKEVRAEERAT